MTLLPQIRFATQRHDDVTWIARAGGEIHVSTATQLGARLMPLVERPRANVVLDLSHVAFIDTTGLGVLLGALRRAERGGGRLVLVCTNPTVLRLFEATHLDETFAICASESAARTLAGQAAGSTAGIP